MQQVPRRDNFSTRVKRLESVYGRQRPQSATGYMQSVGRHGRQHPFPARPVSAMVHNLSMVNSNWFPVVRPSVIPMQKTTSIISSSQIKRLSVPGRPTVRDLRN